MEELKEYCYTTTGEEEIDICVSKDTFKVKSNVNALPDTFLPLHLTTEEQSPSYSGALFIPYTSENKKLQKTDIQEKNMIEALGPEKLLKNKFPMEVGNKIFSIYLISLFEVKCGGCLYSHLDFF
ncbi:uncharacterized protein LOC136087760 [Hydra vulgaris]|uniref:Uncharacterized protein LOC136087760 n=1 Tax=Hydra vulgaris TaxID=6087 RepID=A0ABM4CZ89_HYDVU